MTQSSEPVTPQLQVEGRDSSSNEELEELLRLTPWEAFPAQDVPSEWFYQGMPIEHKRIAITGTMHSGKSTLAGFLEKLGYERRAFALPVKEFSRDMIDALHVSKARLIGAANGWSLDVLDKDKSMLRPLYQFVGAYGRAVFGEDIWVRMYQDRYRDDVGKKAVVDDMRYHNEAEMLRNRGYTLVRIERPERDRKESIQADFEAKHGRRMKKSEMKAIFSHESEIHVPDIEVDIVIRNAGTIRDLEGHARRLAGENIKKVVNYSSKAYNESQKKGGWGDVELPR